MKNCIRCKTDKPLKEFWKSKYTKDGLKAFCIECGKLSNKKYHTNGYMTIYMTQYYKTHNEEKKKRGVRANNYNKKFNRTKIYSDILTKKRKSLITEQPCQFCGSEIVHGHHKDYSKPFDLIWLCPKHHKEVHRGLLTV